MTYRITLPQFEGPFDLLLFFIERDELDIYDIPIAKLTDDFLHYLRQMEAMDMEVAADFIAVAATLMRIKARLLLPRPDLDAAGNELDPRAALVQQLLEHQRYTAALGALQALELARLHKLPRGLAHTEQADLQEFFGAREEVEGITLYKLLRAYQTALARLATTTADAKARHLVLQYPFTIETQRDVVLGLLLRTPHLPFADLFAVCTHKMQLVFTLLAILDMVQGRQLTLSTGHGWNDFGVELVA